ncbi:MAG: hypothetical protein OXT72_05430 [Gammaproteobacteria bacterium]|nr:hypothetical protein [Gammaproteobacteria bacterium]MDE0247805.1 hypothetical protein [Gammaproteobacteria bacterium]
MTRHAVASRAAGLVLLAMLAGCSNSPTEPGESGTQWSLNQTATETRSGVTLVIGYDAARGRFDGTVTNTTNRTVTDVRVEIHLSNRTELGPTSRISLAPQEVRQVTLDNNSGGSFNWYSVHVEIGSSSG